MAVSQTSSNTGLQSATGRAVAQRPKFSVAINSEGYKKLINNTLGDPERAKRFIAAITSAVAVNPALQECDAGTILAGALLGESLNLSPSPQLGQYYLVPFKDKKAGVTKATFVCGYKGLVQLALRSGQYKKLNVLEIKEGELRAFDPLNEVLEAVVIEDYAKREAAPTVGYYVMFEYMNGFRKTMYWSKEKMLSYADQYSPAFSKKAFEKLQNGEIPQSDMWKYSSFWYKDFDTMAKKTMLRQILTHWGIMSTELQRVLVEDGSVSQINDNGEIVTTEETQLDFADTQPEYVDVAEQIDLDNV